MILSFWEGLGSMLLPGGVLQFEKICAESNGIKFAQGSRGTKFQTKDFQKQPPSFVRIIEIPNRNNDNKIWANDYNS